MTNPNDLKVSEAHRVAQHENIKDEIRSEVQGEISTFASEPKPGRRPRK